MKIYRMSLLKRVPKYNFIHFIEDATEFVKLVKYCVNNKCSLSDMLRLPDEDETDGMFYLCAPSCTYEITPFKVVFTDRRTLVTVNVLIDNKGFIKGWY